MDLVRKNKNIAQTMKATFEKRKQQKCLVFKFKIDRSRLTKQQKEQLKMIMVEGKWIYNYLLSIDDIFNFDYKLLKHITHKDKYYNDVDVTLQYIGSSVKQSLIDSVISQIKGLSTHKRKGNKVGKLKYKSEMNSLNFKQYGTTHKIVGSNKFKLQGIKKPLKVFGLEQLNAYDNIDFCNAKLLYNGYDYFIAQTCYVNKETQNQQYKNDIIGLDFGIKTTLTTSNGDKYNITVEESERLKKLQVKLSRQVKGSNNRHKTVRLLKKEYAHISNKKNDIANKIVHSILTDNKIIVMQDEQIEQWRQNNDHYSKSKIQHSILGRIKSKLKQNNRVVILDKWLPTTKHCFNCNTDVELTLNDRTFVCPVCGLVEDRDTHAANNMIKFYYKKQNKDEAGTVCTSKPVKHLAKQEDTTSLALC